MHVWSAIASSMEQNRAREHKSRLHLYCIILILTFLHSTKTSACMFTCSKSWLHNCVPALDKQDICELWRSLSDSPHLERVLKLIYIIGTDLAILANIHSNNHLHSNSYNVHFYRHKSTLSVSFNIYNCKVAQKQFRWRQPWKTDWIQHLWRVEIDLFQNLSGCLLLSYCQILELFLILCFY